MIEWTVEGARATAENDLRKMAYFPLIKETINWGLEVGFKVRRKDGTGYKIPKNPKKLYKTLKYGNNVSLKTWLILVRQEWTWYKRMGLLDTKDAINRIIM